MEIARGRLWYSPTSDGSLSTSSTPILRLRVFGRRPSRCTKCADDLKFFEELARTYVVGSLLNDTFRPFRVANRQFGDEQLRSRWATPLFLPGPDDAGPLTDAGRRSAAERRLGARARTLERRAQHDLLRAEPRGRARRGLASDALAGPRLGAARR